MEIHVEHGTRTPGGELDTRHAINWANMSISLVRVNISHSNCDSCTTNTQHAEIDVHTTVDIYRQTVRVCVLE